MYEGRKTSAVFTGTGQWVETETEVNISDLPAAAAAYIQRNFKDVVIKEVAKIYNAEGNITYEAEIKSKDLMFDAAGNLIKQ